MPRASTKILAIALALGVALGVALVGGLIVLLLLFQPWRQPPHIMSFHPPQGGMVRSRESLRFTFDRPMDQESVEDAFSLRPKAEGILSWEGDKLFFIPTGDGFVPGATYQMTLETSARAKSGAQLRKALSLSFNAYPPLTVVKVEPAPREAEVSADAVIRVQFDRLLGNLEPQPMPLILKPAVEGTGRWEDAFTFVFQPEPGLAPATKYQVVMPRLVESIGHALVSDYSWDFTTRLPGVISATRDLQMVREGVAVRLTLLFNQEMDRASVERSFSLRRSDSTEILPGSFSWRGKALAFEPSLALEVDAEYAVDLRGGFKGEEGPLPSQEDFQWEFRTLSLVEVAQVAPAPGMGEVAPNAPITVRFTRPLVEVSSLEEQAGLPRPVRLEPARKGLGRWLGPALYGFYAEQGLDPATIYTVTIPADFALDHGYALAEDYSWHFNTQLPQVAATFPISNAEAVELAASVSLVFDQEMERTSVEGAFSLAAADTKEAVPGRFSWKDTKLIFTPQQPLRLATWYVGKLEPGIKAARGVLPTEKAYQWSFQSLDYLKVASVQPAPGAEDVGTAAEETLIAVQFNHPVVPMVGVAEQKNLAQPLTFEPHIPGEGEWLNTSLYVFHPSEDLLPATTYRALVAKGLADTLGGYLQQDYIWEFTTKLPAVVATYPGDRTEFVNPTTAITITFNQAMNRASVQEHFRLRLAGAEEGGLKGEFSWTGEDVAVFWPGEALTRGAWYEAAVLKGALGETGAGTAEDFVWSFRAIDVPRIAASSPQDGASQVPSGEWINIGFNVPMDRDSVIENLTLIPSPTQVYSYWTRSDMNLNVYPNLLPSSAYTVVVGAKVSDRYGYPIGTEHLIRFRTAALAPSLYVESIGQVGTYNAYAPVEVRLKYVNTDRANIGLYSMDKMVLLGLLDSWERWQDYVPPEHGLIHRWSQELDAPLNEAKRIEVQVTLADGKPLSPGLYYLEVGSPDAKAKSRQILVVTELNLTLKHSLDQALVWVTDLGSAEPREDLSLLLYNRHGRILGKSTSAADGTCQLRFKAQEPYESLFAFAERGGEAVGMVSSGWSMGVQAWDFGLRQELSRRPYYANLYTDRAIYRPGQVVYYKGILRADDDARYSLPTIAITMPLTVYDARGKKIPLENPTLTPFGTFSGRLPLDEEAPLGLYRLQLRLGEQYFHTSFQVAEYRKPEFELLLATDKDSYVHGDQIAVNVEARYYFAGPVAQAPLRWRLMTSDYYLRLEGERGRYSFTDYDLADEEPRERGKVVTEGKGKTDSEGRFTFKVPADLSAYPFSQIFTLEVEVTDLNNQTVSNRTQAIVHKGHFYVGMKPARYVGRVGEEASIELLTVDTEGNPVGGKSLRIGFYQRKWFNVREKAEDGRYYWTSKYEDTLVAEEEVTTDGDGKGMASFIPDQGGLYRITGQGEDADGNPIRSATYLWVSGREYVSWRMENNERIELVADKEEYQPGETAEILVPSPFAGATALLTLERGRVLSHQVLKLASNSELVKIPITSEHIPNIYVSLVLVKGQDEANPMPAFRVGYLRLAVSTQEKELRISLQPDKEETYTPRESVTYTIGVADCEGKGVEAELSLALLDKAVEALAAERAVPLLAAFYGERPLGVKGGQSLAVLVERLAQRLPEGPKGGGAEAAPPVVRQDFPDTAYWNPIFVTDGEGRGQVAIRLPDNLTTWRLRAKGVTASTLVGSAWVDIVSTKDLLLRPVAPRFFVRGDSVQLEAVVHNNTDEELPATISLSSAGLEILSAAEQTMALGPHEVQKAIWQVRVTGRQETSLTFMVRGGGRSDAVKLTLPIYRLSTPEVVATQGVVEESVTESLVLPEGIDREDGELTLELAPSLAAGVQEALTFLRGYAYGCTEQVVSRFLPNVVTYRALREVGMAPRELEVRLIGEVAIGLQRLYKLQHYDGGWGWWEGGKSLPYLSAYVLYGLLEAERAGFPVESEVMERAASYLRGVLDKPTDVARPESANARAFVLYVLAESGKGNLGRTVALYERREALDNYGRAFLAMALKLLEPTESTRTGALVADLVSRASLSATGAHWEEAYPDWRNMGTDIRSTAIVLQALVRIDPQNMLIPQVVRWLMSTRREGRWPNTQENAYAIMALTDFLLSTGELEADYTYTASLNGKELLRKVATHENLAERVELKVEIKELLFDRANALTLAREAGPGQSGRGKLYYSAHLRYFLSAEEVEALERGIVVAREYIAVDPGTLEPTGERIDAAKVGDVVQVKLTIIAPTTLHYLVVEDPLPAGFEAIDRTLLTASAAAEGPELERTDIKHRYWWYFGHTDVRDEKVALFAERLPAGTYEYTYQMRANVAGEFQVLPAHAYQMYFPEVFGRSAGGKFTVEP